MDKTKKTRIYADHAAAVPVTEAVRAAMESFLAENFGNASSAHFYGRYASRAILDARQRIAAVLGCKPREIFFTSGGTESDNWAVKGTAFAKQLRGHIVTTAIEHPAVLQSVRALERLGMRASYVLPGTDGIIQPESAAAALCEETILIAVMLANNEIGTIQPVRSIAALAQERRIPLFVDAVQGMGQIPVSVSALGVDMLSISGHKIGAPKGIGVLYVREGTELAPLLDGGGQEYGMRAGTESAAAIVGMAQAVEDAAQLQQIPYVETLRDALLERLLRLPHCILNGTCEKGKRLPGNVNVSFPGLDAGRLVLCLDRMGICASGGAACLSGKTEPSHVLLAIGCEPAAAIAALRFTLGANNTMEDVEFIAEAVKMITNQMYGGI